MQQKEKNIKQYKSDINYIGSSDYGSLIIAGHVNGQGFTVQELHFECDGEFWAYHFDHTCNVPDHYDLVAEFDHWMKIYDDSELVKHYVAKKIKVYRTGYFGALIQVLP